jgi:hypothetical protein
MSQSLGSHPDLLDFSALHLIVHSKLQSHPPFLNLLQEALLPTLKMQTKRDSNEFWRCLAAPVLLALDMAHHHTVHLTKMNTLGRHRWSILIMLVRPCTCPPQSENTWVIRTLLVHPKRIPWPR